jgi:hypothetical protein
MKTTKKAPQKKKPRRPKATAAATPQPAFLGRLILKGGGR